MVERERTCEGVGLEGLMSTMSFLSSMKGILWLVAIEELMQEVCMYDARGLLWMKN